MRGGGRARRPREPAGDRRRDPRRGRATRRAASARPGSRERILVAACGRDLPRGIHAIRVAIDTTPLLQTRAGTARYLRGLLDQLGATVELEELRFRATARLRTVTADTLWYPRLRPRTAADVLHCPTF